MFSALTNEADCCCYAILTSWYTLTPILSQQAAGVHTDHIRSYGKPEKVQFLIELHWRIKPKASNIFNGKIRIVKSRISFPWN